MNSNEIAQIFAQQNQMFVGQRQYSQQIGVMAPGMSLSQFGAPRPSMPAGGYSYAPGGAMGAGYGAGTGFAAGAMSTMGGLASALPMMAFDPITAAARGAGMLPGIFGSGGMAGATGAAFGGGIVGAAAAALPVAGLAYGASKAIGSFVGGAQQQQAINSQLGGFNFVNGGSRTGMGFTRDDAQAIGNQVRAISHIPEMMTSVEELTRLLPKMRQMGVMQGVHDASEFAGRFRETVKTIRDMSKILGSSMEEAADFFSQSRSVGFLGRQAQMKNALNVQFTAGMTGMSTGQVMGLQMTGAGMAQQSGASRRLGAEAVTNIAQSLGMGMRTGAIAQEQMENITGMQGADAVQASAQRMTQIMMNLSQAPAGRLAMLGMIKFDENGKAVGIDEAMARRFQEGGVSMGELKSRAQRLTQAQKITAIHRMPNLAMSLAGKVGPGGMAQFFKMVGEDRFGEEGVGELLTRQGGATADEADIMLQLAGQVMGGGGQKSFAQRQMMEAKIRERTDPKAIFNRLKTKIFVRSGMAAMEQAGSQVGTAFSKAFDDFVDDLVGRHFVTMSEEGARTLSRAFTSKAGRDEVAGALQSIGGLRAGAGFGKEGFHIGTTATDQSRDVLKRLGIAESSNVGGTDTAMASRVSALQSAGAQAMTPEVREAINNMVGGISGFRDMSNAQKESALRSAIEGQIGGAWAGATPNAALSKFAKQVYGQGGGQGDFYTAVATSMSGGLYDPSKTGSMSDIAVASDIRQLQAKQKESMTGLKRAYGGGVLGFGGLGEDVASLMQSRPGAANLLRSFTGLDGDKQSRIQNILNTSSREEAAALLEKEGFGGIKPEDIDTLQKAVTKAKDPAVVAAMKEHKKWQAAGDFLNHRENIKASLAGVGDAKLRGLLDAYSSEMDSTKIGAARGAVESYIQGEALTKASSLKGDARDAFIQSLGDYGGGVSRAAGLNVKSLQGKSLSSIMKATGLSADELAGLKITEGHTGNLSGLKGYMALHGVEKQAAGSAGDSALPVDVQIKDALRDLNKTLAANTTVIQVATGMLDPAKGREMLKAMTETAPSGKSAQGQGTTPPGQ